MLTTSYVVITKEGTKGRAAREIPAGRRTAELVDAMQAQNRASFPTQAAFDGVKNLFTTKKLNGREFHTILFTINVTDIVLPHHSIPWRWATRGRAKYVIRLALVGQINPA